jgi:magnesium-transporting ATPase (P-type)
MLWKVGPKRMTKNSFTVIRDGKIDKNMPASQLVLGDIVVLTQRSNPYTPEECIIVSHSNWLVPFLKF